MIIKQQAQYKSGSPSNTLSVRIHSIVFIHSIKWRNYIRTIWVE